MWRLHDPGPEGEARLDHGEVMRACHELRGSLMVVRLGLAGGTAMLSGSRLRALELELEKAALALDDLASAHAPIPQGLTCSPVAPVDLWALLDDTLEAWRGAAQRCGVQLRLRRSRAAEGGDAVSVIEGDRLRLAQAVGNLIANAIEHGGGRVEVGVRAEGGWVRIEVTDGGRGLPAPVEELMRRAGQGAGARGHGLSITAAIAVAHGGRVAAAPSDRGARLVLELPRREEAEGAERQPGTGAGGDAPGPAVRDHPQR
jgi:signal transduction histidine kinase